MVSWLCDRCCSFFSCCLFCSVSSDHRDLHVLTHSFPTRRSSDLTSAIPCCSGSRRTPARRASATGTASGTSGTAAAWARRTRGREAWRSEEHTSELQSLMRNSYAVFCLKKKNENILVTPLTNYQIKGSKNISRHHTSGL